MAEPKRKTVRRRSRKGGGARSRRRAGVHHKASPPPPPSMSVPESGLAPGMQLVNMYLAVANVTASIEFLEKAFGFVRGVALADPDGQVRYAEMRHGDAAVMLVRK